MSVKQYRIKDIAKMAGVSAGTVDRVLHNRGEVSPKSREKIEAVLAQIDYKPNLYVSSIGVKKKISIVVVLPSFTPGGYWEQIEKGIKHAMYEFSYINLKIKFLHYDQFDLYSCREIYGQALNTPCDAVLIGPTFTDETLQFAYRLETKGIPYVFVDVPIANANPLAFFGPDSYTLGQIQAKLLIESMDKNKEVVMLRTRRIGDEPSTTSIIRRSGFLAYIREHHPQIKALDVSYDISNNGKNAETFDTLFREHPNIGGIVVFNSRAHIIASYLKQKKIQGINLVGYGVIAKNIASLKEGYITFLLSERPDKQGYSGIKTILEYKLFGKKGEMINYTPVDILIKENVDYYVHNNE